MATSQQEALFRQGRFALAVQAYKQGQIPTLLAAFRLGRLVGRVLGRPDARDARALR